MCKMQQPLVCAGWNLYSLRKNPRFYLSLTLGFLLCWLLTDKTMQISRTYLTSVQLVEPFVWCYADGDSILYAALVLMLMLSALPRMDTPASYLIFRTTRRSWLIGQIITVLIVTFGYCLMILISSMLMCIGCNVYATNRWSETATMLSFAPKTGMLIETPGFLPHETGMSNLLWLAKLGNGARCEDVAALMRLVGLDPAAKKRVSQYSLGMRQRLGIAQALLDAPELLILDEPMNGLDKNGVTEIRALLLDLRAQGKTILLASHFAQDIDALCDTVQEMAQGRIREV